MDQDLREMVEENNELLKKLVKVSGENHKRIRKIRANMRSSFVARIVYWILIILVTAGAFYAIKPTVDRLLEQYNIISEQVNEANNYIQNPGQLIERSFAPSGVSGLTEINNISDLTSLEFLGGLLGRDSSDEDSESAQ